MSTVSRTWLIHSISGIMARSGPKQEKRDPEGKHGRRGVGAKFEGNFGRRREELEGGHRGVKGGLQIGQRLLRVALRGFSPLGLEGSHTTSTPGVAHRRSSQPAMPPGKTPAGLSVPAQETTTAGCESAVVEVVT